MGERKTVTDQKKNSVCMYHSVDFTSFKQIFNAAEKTFSHKKSTYSTILKRVCFYINFIGRIRRKKAQVNRKKSHNISVMSTRVHSQCEAPVCVIKWLCMWLGTWRNYSAIASQCFPYSPIAITIIKQIIKKVLMNLTTKSKYKQFTKSK